MVVISTAEIRVVTQRTSEFYHADQSSSGCIRGGYISQNNIIPSGQTSINVQVNHLCHNKVIKKSVKKMSPKHCQATLVLVAV